MNYYVYKLEHVETGEFYYGSRKTKKAIELDKYMGSMITWKPNKNKLIKTIIKSDFNNYKDMILYECKMIKENNA